MMVVMHKRMKRRNKEIGARIRHLRLASYMTLADVSRVTKLGIATLSFLENGKRKITIDDLEQLGKALNIDPKRFFEVKGSR